VQTICTSFETDNHTTPTPHHSIFKGQILVLTPIQQCQRTEGKSSEGKSLQHHIKLLIFSSVRPSTPFLADTDTPIFCCQSNTIPIRYRFFDMLQERTWRRVTDRSKAPDAAAATNNSGAPWTRCSAAAMPLISRGQSNTATISKV